MIIRDFLRWIGTAPLGSRAEATSALARAWLHSEMSDEERRDAEAAMTVLLDDPEPVVRAALADALGASARAPRHIILALATDIPPIATLVLMRSPLFLDSELVDFAASHEVEVQVAIALRPKLAVTVSAVIAELGEADACLELIGNPGAAIGRSSYERIAERFEDDARVRCALMQGPRVPLTVKQSLVARLSRKLAKLPVVQSNIRAGSVESVMGEARDKVTVSLACDAQEDEIGELVEHLRATAQLTPTLILRAVCTGNVILFEQALARLTELPLWRIRALTATAGTPSLRSLVARAGLPRSTHAAFVAAMECYRTQRAKGLPLRGPEFTRHMIREVLSRYDGDASPELDQLRRLLYRLEGEAARGAARQLARTALTAA